MYCVYCERVPGEVKAVCGLLAAGGRPPGPHPVRRDGRGCRQGALQARELRGAEVPRSQAAPPQQTGATENQA